MIMIIIIICYIMLDFLPSSLALGVLQEQNPPLAQL